jgi:hypothetical protein
MLQPKGRVVKSGEPFIAKDGEFVRVTFLPIFSQPNEGPADAYAAEVDRETSEFIVEGKDGRGLPPGKYRVAIELDKRRSDLLKGKYGQDKSPFVFDIDADTKELVLDLDQIPKG